MTKEKLWNLTNLYHSYLINRMMREEGVPVREPVTLCSMAKIYSEETGIGIDFKSQEKIIIDWVSEQVNGPLLNILIGEAVNLTDGTILNHLEAFQKIGEEYLTIYKKIDKPDVKLAPYSREQLLADITTFCQSMDESSELETCLKANLGQTILILNDLSKDEQNFWRSLFDLEEGASATYDSYFGSIALISLDNTIGDLPNFIHEFMHFVNIDQVASASLLSEYPSILWELYILIYLKSRGHNPEELKLLAWQRFADLVKATENLNNLLALFKIFLAKGVLGPEDLKGVNEQELIDFLVKNGSHINQIYSYILGSWLAVKSIEQIGKAFTAQKLMNISRRVRDINLITLIKVLDANMGRMFDSNPEFGSASLKFLI